MNSHGEQVRLIHEMFPELIVDKNENRKWHWYLRCTSSEEHENTENGFNSPVEAVAAFAKYLLDAQDAEMEAELEEEVGDYLTRDVLNQLREAIPRAVIFAARCWGLTTSDLYDAIDMKLFSLTEFLRKFKPLIENELPASYKEAAIANLRLIAIQELSRFMDEPDEFFDSIGKPASDKIPC